MGVAGCGKTSVGEALARALGWGFNEGDAHHAPASIAKMQAGQPLADEDRWGWLDQLGQMLRTQIAAVPGVDLLFIGPYDFSAALGFPGEPDHPQVRARIEAIEAACRASRVPIGGIPTPGRSARELIEAGYALILCGSDVAFLREGARAQLDALDEPRAAARKR